MNKRILLSLGTLVVAGAVIVGGTGAFFSDTETSTGNVFTAGAVDLMVDHTAQTYNGIECGTCEVTIQSDTDNLVVAQDGAAITPYNAVIPNDPGPNWADEFNDAIWIWGEEDLPSSTDNTEYTFQNTFDWWGGVGAVSVTLTLASDDDYEIFLNGNSVASGANAWQNTVTINLDENDIVNGENVIEFVIINSGANRAGLLYEMQILRAGCENDFAQFQAQCELWVSTDLTTETFFNFSDIKPQDSGSNVISLRVESNDAFACMNVVNKEDLENTINNPEDVAGDTTDPEGEMGSFLTVRGFYSDVNGNELGELFPATLAKDLGTIVYADSTGGTPIVGNTTEYVKFDWCMGNFNPDGSCDGSVADINQTQTDQFLADLQFSVIQTRNNDAYVCPDIADTVI